MGHVLPFFLELPEGNPKTLDVFFYVSVQSLDNMFRHYHIYSYFDITTGYLLKMDISQNYAELPKTMLLDVAKTSPIQCLFGIILQCVFTGVG